MTPAIEGYHTGCCGKSSLVSRVVYRSIPGIADRPTLLQTNINNHVIRPPTNRPTTPPSNDIPPRQLHTSGGRTHSRLLPRPLHTLRYHGRYQTSLGADLSPYILSGVYGAFFGVVGDSRRNGREIVSVGRDDIECSGGSE